MYPRTNYEMTQAQLDKILDACRPTPVMKIGSYEGSNPQENANAAWRALGEEIGFDHMTVQPTGQGDRFFTAVPTEPETIRAQRLEREEGERKQKEIEDTEAEIRRLNTKLERLTK